VTLAAIRLKESAMRLETKCVKGSLRGALLFAALLGLHASSSTLVAQTSNEVSLTLNDAIDMALKNNRVLQLAGLDVTDSEHQKKIAQAAYFPQITNESTALHLTELAGVVIPPGTFGNTTVTGPIPAHTLTIDQGELTAYTSGTGLAQPITQMFKIRASNRAAAADVETAKIKLKQTQDEIALKVRQVYYGVLIAQLKQQAEEEQVQAAEQVDQESQSDVERGAALEVAALESHAAWLNAKQSVLAERLEVDDLTLNLDDMLGLPIGTRLKLDPDAVLPSADIPSRADGLRIAKDQNPQILAARQAVVKAKAGVTVSKDAYIPDVTGVARYSYQSGVPLLVHNFGTFGVTLTYDLFDGGKRNEEIRHSQTLLNEAELNLARLNEELEVQVNAAYDKVERIEGMLGVAREVMDLRTEAARVADRQFDQSSILTSDKTKAHALATEAHASLVEATLGLSLAQNEVKRTIGQMPR
jgi:outer membrane protein TolC